MVDTFRGIDPRTGGTIISDRTRVPDGRSYSSNMLWEEPVRATVGPCRVSIARAVR